MQFFGNAIISFIEKELVKHSPEIEAMMMEQISQFTDMLMSYVTSKEEEKKKEDPAKLAHQDK